MIFFSLFENKVYLCKHTIINNTLFPSIKLKTHSSTLKHLAINQVKNQLHILQCIGHKILKLDYPASILQLEHDWIISKSKYEKNKTMLLLFPFISCQYKSALKTKCASYILF